MSEQKIEPALTEAEWTTKETLRGFDGVVVRIGMGRVITDSPFGPQRPAGILFAKPGHRDEFPLPVIEGNALPALIALANAALPASDPRKITEETVNFLREWAKECAESFNSTMEDDAPRFTALANALASYLPPETT